MLLPFFSLLIPTSAYSNTEFVRNDLFFYSLIFLNISLIFCCILLLRNHQGRAENSSPNEIRENVNEPKKIYGVERLKELFSCDFEAARALTLQTLENEKEIGLYLISKLPLRELIELRKSLNSSQIETFFTCLNSNSLCLNQDINLEYEQKILSYVYNFSFREGKNNRYEVIRAERWAALIKKDTELGKYLFLFSEMNFIAKVFSFLEKEDINLVMDLVFEDKNDIQTISKKVDEFLNKAQKDIEINNDFQKMLNYFTKYNDDHLGLGIEKISIFHKNEIKVFDILIKNISPTLLTLISSEIFNDLRHKFSKGEFYRYLICLPQEKRAVLFNKFLKPNSNDVDEYKRFLTSSNGDLNQEDEQIYFKKKFHEVITSNTELYKELFNYWKLPLKRLTSGMSFENSFKDYYSLKKSA